MMRRETCVKTFQEIIQYVQYIAGQKINYRVVQYAIDIDKISFI